MRRNRPCASARHLEAGATHASITICLDGLDADGGPVGEFGARQNPQEWIALGTRVHGGFGAFIPLGIRIGLDAVARLHAKPRELAVVYHDSVASPCACFADGVAIATSASVGQRTLTIAAEPAPEGAIAVVVIRAARRRRGI